MERFEDWKLELGFSVQSLRVSSAETAKRIDPAALRPGDCDTAVCHPIAHIVGFSCYRLFFSPTFTIFKAVAYT